MKKHLNLIAAAVVSSLTATSVHAIQFDGFMTTGMSQIVQIEEADKGNIYLGALGDRGITEDLTFERDTRFGLQISSDVAENMSVVAQLLGAGDNNNFNAIVEWAYIDYEINDITSIHVGKIKQPVYLVNDYVEVGYAYPWIRPPAEVYFENNPLNTVNGIELLIQLPVGPGTLSFQPYLGSNRDDIPNAQGAFFEAENIYGMDIKYSGRGYSAHASYFQCEVKTFGEFTIEGVTFPTPGGPVVSDVDVDLNGKGDCEVSAVGFNLDIANVVVYAEAQNRTTTDTLSRAFGDTTSYYTTFGYRIGKFLPHLTFAATEGEASRVGLTPSGFGFDVGNGAATTTNPALGGASFNFPVAIQTSITAGLRYEVNDSAALKFEYQVIDVETDAQELADANQSTNYGLFDTNFLQSPPSDNIGIVSVALDVIF